MKERLMRAILVAVVAAIGITLVTLMQGERFSVLRTGLYAVVAFVVDYIFANLFDRK